MRGIKSVSTSKDVIGDPHVNCLHCFPQFADCKSIVVSPVMEFSAAQFEQAAPPVDPGEGGEGGGDEGDGAEPLVTCVRAATTGAAPSQPSSVLQVAGQGRTSA